MSILGRLLDVADQKLICQDCNNTFYHSISEQNFFKKRNFETPKRCLFCRKQKKNKNLRTQKAIIQVLENIIR